MVLKIQQRFRQIRRGEHWRHGHGRESPEGEDHLDKPELGYTLRSRLPGFVARPEPLADLRGCYSHERPSRLLLFFFFVLFLWFWFLFWFVCCCVFCFLFFF